MYKDSNPLEQDGAGAGLLGQVTDDNLDMLALELVDQAVAMIFQEMLDDPAVIGAARAPQAFE
jgi:hypothetical protein